ncbi:MAG: hypothetical protein CMH83_07365 [Nocardioides sp.]|nr:hypothetical protein [Nocardioides sp.]
MRLVTLDQRVLDLPGETTRRLRVTDRAGLYRALGVDDAVVAVDQTGEFFGARVLETGESGFWLEIGVRLPQKVAQDRLKGGAAPAERETTHTVLDMLGELRRLRRQG